MRSRQAEASYQYIKQTFAKSDDALAQAQEKGEELRAGMQVSPVEGQMLTVLTKLAGARRILEIGTFVGYSTLHLARALPEDGEIITIEADDVHADAAEAHFATAGMSEQITLIRGKALDVLPTLAGQQFEVVFIDAVKQEYPDYLLEIRRLLAPNGLIIADNTLLFGAMYGEPAIKVGEQSIAAMQAFNRELAEDSGFDSVLLPTVEGMTIARKKA